MYIVSNIKQCSKDFNEKQPDPALHFSPSQNPVPQTILTFSCLYCNFLMCQIWTLSIYFCRGESALLQLSLPISPCRNFPSSWPPQLYHNVLVKSVFNIYITYQYKYFHCCCQIVYHAYFLIVTMFCFSWNLELIFLGLFVTVFFCTSLFSSKIVKMNYKVLPKSISHNRPSRVMYWSISLSLPGDVILLLFGLAAFGAQCAGVN